ncbi:hypothetical protein [Accumulibacter sp.]|jgi:hypothetical protein|uniref:hypothetical protein n=1 Tax=Accumulibacter sp. TaxID=2053492 RepID=UPI002BBFA5EB|nr:hypothetical protein [Accumulibacter sp.]HPU80428.1 hypothetical protein [Accumulibacter sp.]
MSLSATLPDVDAIDAAAHELKLRRFSGTASESPAQQNGKTKQSKALSRVRCKVRLTASELQMLARLKKRLARRGIATRKQDLVRAGLLLLVHLDRADFKAAIRDVIAPEPAPGADH